MAVSVHALNASPRIMLVIDDQHSVCVSLSYLLGDTGYHVVTAGSGRTGIALYESEPCDGAIIDVHMPGMNGFDTCITLQAKAAALGRVLRVWFMTGAFTCDLQRRSSELGALGVFRKPFDFPSFVEQLEAGFSASPSAPAALSIPDGVGAGSAEIGLS